MNTQIENVRNEYVTLLKISGFPLTEREVDSLEVKDFGLDNVRTEGFGLIDLLRTQTIRINLIVLLPHQTLPQHLHPSYDNEPGKEETLRVLYGTTRVFVEGAPSPCVDIPAGKEQWYTALKKIELDSGAQYSVPPNTKHWFQAGENGSVNIAFQNRVDESKNIFYDPDSDGCKISNEVKY